GCAPDGVDVVDGAQRITRRAEVVVERGVVVILFRAVVVEAEALAIGRCPVQGQPEGLVDVVDCLATTTEAERTFMRSAGGVVNDFVLRPGRVALITAGAQVEPQHAWQQGTGKGKVVAGVAAEAAVFLDTVTRGEGATPALDLLFGDDVDYATEGV